MQPRRDVFALVAAIALAFALGACGASNDAVPDVLADGVAYADADANADTVDSRYDEDSAVDALDVSGNEGPSEVKGSDGTLLDEVDDEADVCPCGKPCQNDADCDDGNPCTVESCDGTWGYCSNLGEGEWIDCGPGRSCDPATGECRDDCVLGTSVPCSRQNAFGTCQGVRVCEPAGLADCDATEPSKEECNLVDDNCNGQTDEGFPDANQDGIPDCLCDDDDYDGFSNTNCGQPDGPFDNCPKVPNPDQANWDKDVLGGVLGDNKGDACDEDDDNDGVNDGDDCDPKNFEVYPGAAETCDGQDNNCDNLVDEGFANGDGDALADCIDPDLDNDGRLNEGDNCPAVFNPGQQDADDDGVGDACE